MRTFRKSSAFFIAAAIAASPALSCKDPYKHASDDDLTGNACNTEQEVHPDGSIWPPVLVHRVSEAMLPDTMSLSPGTADTTIEYLQLAGVPAHNGPYAPWNK